MIQHGVKLNSLLVLNLIVCMNVILYNSEDEKVACVVCSAVQSKL